MLVAITQRNELNRHKESIDSLENKYINYLESFGIKLLIIPNVTENLNFYFDLFPIEGIILSGGNDIPPLLYNKKYQNEMSISKKRDKIEFRLIEIAIEKKIPLLGICRGMQIINVFFKGEICLLNGHPPAKNHKINFLEFKEKFDNEVIVNSYHNYGIKKKQLSEILKPLAE